MFEADVRGAIINALYSASGESPVDQSWRFAIDPKDAASMAAPKAPKKPNFVTDADIDFFVGEFTRTGFAGGINYYRNIDRNWELTPFLDGAQLPQPTLFIAGDRDAVLGFWGEYVGAMESNVPNLVRKLILPGVGHWTQQERPAEVNQLLVEFLRSF
jgi:pimeloyl-ACP methyl ester carboxylesterase